MAAPIGARALPIHDPSVVNHPRIRSTPAAIPTEKLRNCPIKTTKRSSRAVSNGLKVVVILAKSDLMPSVGLEKAATSPPQNVATTGARVKPLKMVVTAPRICIGHESNTAPQLIVTAPQPSVITVLIVPLMRSPIRPSDSLMRAGSNSMLRLLKMPLREAAASTAIARMVSGKRSRVSNTVRVMDAARSNTRANVCPAVNAAFPTVPMVVATVVTAVPTSPKPAANVPTVWPSASPAAWVLRSAKTLAIPSKAALITFRMGLARLKAFVTVSWALPAPSSARLSASAAR